MPEDRKADVSMVFITGEELQRRFGEFFEGDLKSWRAKLINELKRHLLPKENGYLEFEPTFGLFAIKGGINLEGKRIVVTFKISTLFDVPFADPVKLAVPYAEVTGLEAVDQKHQVSDSELATG